MTKREFLHKITSRFKGNSLYSKLLGITGAEIKNHKWVFIIGCYNSGTTLLEQILSEHSLISGLPDEGVMLTNQLLRPEDFGWRRMWSECEEQLKSTNQTIDAPTIKKHWSHFYDVEKPYLLEKSISNTCRIPFFNQNFQPAFFIHIVRNGYAVAEGIQRKAKIIEGNPMSGLEKYPIDLCAKQWVRSLEVVEQEKGNIENFLEISYEDLTANPERVLQKVTDFLSLKSLDKDYFNNAFKVHEKKSPITNMNYASFNRLTPDDIKIINEVAGVYLQKYGYNIL